MCHQIINSQAEQGGEKLWHSHDGIRQPILRVI